MAHRRTGVLRVATYREDDVDGAREGTRAAGAVAHFAPGLTVVAGYQDREALGRKELEWPDRLERIARVVLRVAPQPGELRQRVDDENPGADRPTACRDRGDDGWPRGAGRVSPA